MLKKLYKETEQKMSRIITAYNEDLQSIRAGRANPALLDKISIDYYGQITPLKQVSSISAPEPRLLVIQPWDANLIPIIEKEILKSDLGLNPSNDGKLIRLVIPVLTEERRRDLTKLVKKNGEDAKVSIRNIRRDSNDQLKKMEKDKHLSEDEKRFAEDEIQNITNKCTEELDKIIEKKEDELMEI
ncbi:MAG TPA: ribosome recycling factor [Tissierellaceae bacterium]|nr:ribosome recycling factor [Tissierellaceae bacterium]